MESRDGIRTWNLVTDNAIDEIICGRCGLVISDKIQETELERHYYYFNNEKINDQMRMRSSIRTGMPFSLAHHDMRLDTIIGRTDRDAHGHKLDKSMHTKIDRLRKWDFRSRIYSLLPQ